MSYGSDSLRKMYYGSPYWVKTFFTSSYGLLQRHQRYGSFYHEQLELLNESQYWSNERISDYQRERVEGFLKIVLNVSYYKNHSEYSGLHGGGLEIQKYPILSKKSVKLNPREFYNPEIKDVVWGHTSGTTGSAMVFPLSLEAFQKEYAFRSLHYNWSGVSLDGKDKIAMCSGHPVCAPERTLPPFWTYDAVNHHLFFSSYHLTNIHLKYYIKKLEEFDPLLLHGYPSSIFLIALAYKKFGTRKLKLKSIFTSSETLLELQRETIEEIFQVKVFNWYGTSEMSVNIVECEKGELHLKAEHSFIEIVNSDNRECKPGESGRIISTNFNNPAFPLIRYDLGDIVTISKNQVSKCGRSGLLIDYIEGRVEDYILTPDGRFVGRLDHLFKDAQNVIEAQIEQRNIEEVIIRIVPRDGYYKDDELSILKEARIRLGSSIKISFEYVSKIDRSANGKFRFIVSKIDTQVCHL